MAHKTFTAILVLGSLGIAACGSSSHSTSTSATPTATPTASTATPKPKPAPQVGFQRMGTLSRSLKEKFGTQFTRFSCTSQNAARTKAVCIGEPVTGKFVVFNIVISADGHSYHAVK